MTTDNRTNEPRRLKSCVAAWPECSTGEYNPSCCRFPKSCSATVYSEEHVTEDDLEPPTALVAAQGAAPQAECDCGAGPGSAVCKKVCATRLPVLPSSTVDEDRAEAVREVARYINRIAPNGLVSKKMILADMELAADRPGRGIHANGNDRAGRVLAGKEKNDEKL